MIRQLVLDAVVNPAVIAILRSPAHRLLSGRLFLLSYTGRVSGRRYTFPVDYRIDCHGLRVLTYRERGWWQNFAASPREISIRYNGRQLAGTARAVTDELPVAGALSDRFGWSNERADAEARDWVVLRIELADEPEPVFDNPAAPP